MIRFIAALVVALIGWGGVMVTQKFHYKALSRKQLAQMVYDLNKQIVDLEQDYPISGPVVEEITIRAKKMINRARLEGLL